MTAKIESGSDHFGSLAGKTILYTGAAGGETVVISWP
jgi:fibrillarin-like rRNA methylase